MHKLRVSFKVKVSWGILHKIFWKLLNFIFDFSHIWKRNSSIYRGIVSTEDGFLDKESILVLDLHVKADLDI